MSPTKPRSPSRPAGETRVDMPKTAKPRAARAAKPAAEKTVKPRAARPRLQEAAEQQFELIAPIGQEAQSHPAPVRAQAPGKLRTGAPAPAPEQRRPGLLLVALVLVLMLGSFWIGRISSRPATQEIASLSAASAPTPAAATAPAVTAQIAAGAKPAATASPAAGRRAGAETSLVEVSVGTTSRGGLTLRFDHPVAWQLDGAQGGGQAELEVHGVRALGTFPRNLPLPPGVSTLRAGITAPGTLNLRFGLQAGIRAYTVPDTGPAAALNIYFRTPAEEAEAASESATGACGSSTSPQAAKAVALLQRSLDKNPGYEAVRQALALLETCAGDGAKAEQLLAEGSKSEGGVKLAVTDVALRYARGDVDGALQELKAGMPAGNSDAGYQELLADLEAAKQP